jgi:hypothetical protein
MAQDSFKGSRNGTCGTGDSSVTLKLSLNAMIAAYQARIDWLLVQAEEFEFCPRKVTGRVGDQEVDIAASFAAETGIRLVTCSRA